MLTEVHSLLWQSFATAICERASQHYSFSLERPSISPKPTSATRLLAKRTRSQIFAPYGSKYSSRKKKDAWLPCKTSAFAPTVALLFPAHPKRANTRHLRGRTCSTSSCAPWRATASMNVSLRAALKTASPCVGCAWLRLVHRQGSTPAGPGDEVPVRKHNFASGLEHLERQAHGKRPELSAASALSQCAWTTKPGHEAMAAAGSRMTHCHSDIQVLQEAVLTVAAEVAAAAAKREALFTSLAATRTAQHNADTMLSEAQRETSALAFEIKRLQESNTSLHSRLSDICESLNATLRAVFASC
eukprot:m.255419 g.255419  ORF g.255419 m.255419 type:complete len:302 (+) comp11011_c0_seq25:1451-2356(+)